MERFFYAQVPGVFMGFRSPRRAGSFAGTAGA
jgi:hypothetical protein